MADMFPLDSAKDVNIRFFTYNIFDGGMIMILPEEYDLELKNISSFDDIFFNCLFHCTDIYRRKSIMPYPYFDDFGEEVSKFMLIAKANILSAFKKIDKFDEVIFLRYIYDIEPSFKYPNPNKINKLVMVYENDVEEIVDNPNINNDDYSIILRILMNTFTYGRTVYNM